MTGEQIDIVFINHDKQEVNRYHIPKGSTLYDA